MRKCLIILVLLTCCASMSVAAGQPVIFFSDLTSGPNGGGQNNKGAFVTIWGKNFGSYQGTNQVLVGEGAVDNCPVWTDSKITFQLGSNAKTGGIVVVTGQGTSNKIPFVVRAGSIYFVKTTGSDSNPGSWEFPWRTMVKAKNSLAPGDIAYIGDGVTQTTVDAYNATLNCGSHGTLDMPKALVAYPGATVVVGSTNISRGFHFFVSGGAGGYSGKYWVISQLTITAQTSAISGGEGRRIIGNKITTPVGTGAAAATESGDSNVKILGNEYYNCGSASASKLYHNIYINNHSGVTISAIEIAWNTIRNSTANRAIQVFSDGSGHADIANVSIHDNRIYNVRGNGINLSNHCTGDFKVYNNIIYNCGIGPDPYDGMTSYAGILIGGGTGEYVNDATIQLYNNLIADCGYAGNPNGSGLLNIAGSYTGRPIIKNNIFYSSGSSWQPYMVSGSNVPATGSYNNLFYGNGLPPSWDTAALNAAPEFLDYTNKDFHLKKESPCADRGQDTTAVTAYDCDGVARPQGAAVDVGAYELIGELPVPPPPPLPGLDSTPPAAITDLRLTKKTSVTITLSWAAPGDDGSIGTASNYDIRYSNTRISESNFNLAKTVSDAPTPAAAGTKQSYTISGLNENTLYYCAIKTRDEAGNTSLISNQVKVTTYRKRKVSARESKRKR